MSNIVKARRQYYTQIWKQLVDWPKRKGHFSKQCELVLSPQQSQKKRRAFSDIYHLNISVGRAFNRLRKLNIHKVSGPDNISTAVMKETADTIATPLTHIYNRSLQTGIVPADWWKALVTRSTRKVTSTSVKTIVQSSSPALPAKFLNI